MIKLQNVSKVYHLGKTKVSAVDKVSLKIEPKEYVGILGSSGSGKSTLMYLIGLLEKPTAGKVLLDKKDTSTFSDEKLSVLRNNHIGFVFQQFNLINRFTVLENVLLPTKYIKKRLDFNPKKRATEILDKFGILERKDFFPNKISGGEQQRVAIARALIMKPKIVLADEPTGNIDTKTGEEILDILGDLNKDFNVTVIVVTHEKRVAKRAQRKIYIRDGKVVDKYL